MSTPPRRVPKVLRVLLIVAAVALLGVGGVLLARGPRLRPVAVRHLRGQAIVHAYWVGYPVAVAQSDDDLVSFGFSGNGALVDARCQPVAGPAVELKGRSPVASPSGNVVAWTEGNDLVYAWRDGRRQRVPTREYLDLYFVSDSGTVCTSSQSACTVDGKRVTFPGRKSYQQIGIYCANPRYLAAYCAAEGKLYLYDLTARRFIAGHPFPAPGWGGFAGMVFDQGKRCIVVPKTGKALVFEGAKRIGTYGKANTEWAWSGDGSVWTLDKQTLRVLHWRTGTPAFTTRRLTGAADDRFFLFSDVAVWQDGYLLARTETIPAMPEKAMALIERAAKKLHLELTLPGDKRRLTLYRDGRRVGTASLSLFTGRRTSSPQSYSERLCFSPNGRHLCWELDGGRGLEVRVYAMETHHR